MSPPLPPIYRDCLRLLVHAEELSRRFLRHHRCAVGSDLRQGAMRFMRTVNQAAQSFFLAGGERIPAGQRASSPCGLIFDNR